MTSTSAAIFVLLDGTVFPAVMIPLPFEVTLMTGRAERCVSGRGIDKRAVHAATVAAAAPRVVPVVARIVPLGVMAEAGRRPARGDMTRVALDGGG